MPKSDAFWHKIEAELAPCRAIANSMLGRREMQALLDKADPPGRLCDDEIEVEYDARKRRICFCLTSVHDGIEIISWCKLPRAAVQGSKPVLDVLLHALKLLWLAPGRKMDGHYEEWSGASSHER